MTDTKKRKNLRREDPVPELKPGMHSHSRAPNAAIEQLLAVAGIVSIDGPTPSHKFIDEESDQTANGHGVN